jgi:hypothetical protein
VPEGYGRAEALALAATWYLNPPAAGRLGYFGSFDLDILDFYRAPLKRVIETFVTSRDPGFVTNLLRRGSVDYVVTMDPAALWSSLPLVVEERTFFEAPVRVYRVPDPWPRVRIESADGSRLEGSAQALEMRDGGMRIDVNVPDFGHLVVATAYDKGWHATSDGSPIQVSENALAFLSIPLTTGHHVVDLDYVPPLILPGLAISLASGLAAILLAVRGRSRVSVTPE